MRPEPFGAYAWGALHWVDILSVATGILYAWHQHHLAAGSKKLICKETGLDFLGGLALAPLALMFAGAFSETVLQALMRTNAIILAGASIIALFSILEERE